MCVAFAVPTANTGFDNVHVFLFTCCASERSNGLRDMRNVRNVRRRSDVRLVLVLAVPAWLTHLSVWTIDGHKSAID